MSKTMFNSVWSLAAEGEAERLAQVVESHKGGEIFRPLEKQESDRKAALLAKRAAQAVQNKKGEVEIIFTSCDTLIPHRLRDAYEAKDTGSNPFLGEDQVNPFVLENFYQAQLARTGVGINIACSFMPKDVKKMLPDYHATAPTKAAIIYIGKEPKVAAALWDVYQNIPGLSDPITAEDLDSIEDDSRIPFLAVARIGAALVNEQVHLGRAATGMNRGRFVEEMLSTGMPWGRAKALLQATRMMQTVPRIDAILAASLFVNGVEATREQFAKVYPEETAKKAAKKNPGMRPA